MFMMNEKRKYSRRDAEIPVSCFVIDGRRKKRKISYELISRTMNVSRAGCCLLWPKKWKCKSCLKCVGWVFNHNCNLKKEHLLPGEVDRYLAKDMVINIKMAPPITPTSINLVGKVVWVNPQTRGKGYKVGISFLGNYNGNLAIMH